MDDKKLLDEFNITEDQVSAWAQKIENEDLSDYDFSKAQRGRPKTFNEELETITVRIPKSKAKAISLAAKSQGITKSEWCRQAMNNALKAS